MRWRTLCTDVELERVEKSLRAMRPVALAATAAPSTAPDRLPPATYVVCERDQLLSVEAQEMWARRADHVVRLPSSQPVDAVDAGQAGGGSRTHHGQLITAHLG
ncbi:MAG: hypothetical protein ABS81_13720 [Pseudonocardia sp. SCN 72-86]|nr:MAG: hypothetical protein ABS81_13720 [Pseudonocardia sp. SCN 72-86]